MATERSTATPTPRRGPIVKFGRKNKAAGDLVTVPDGDAFFGTLRSEFDEEETLPRVLNELREAYTDIRTRYDIGEISKTDLAEALSGLRCRSALGVEWTMGASTGSWYRRISGTSWLAALPPTLVVGSGESDTGWTGPHMEPTLPAGVSAAISEVERPGDEGAWWSVDTEVNSTEAQARYLASLTGGSGDDQGLNYQAYDPNGGDGAPPAAGYGGYGDTQPTNAPPDDASPSASDDDDDDDGYGYGPTPGAEPAPGGDDDLPFEPFRFDDTPPQT